MTKVIQFEETGVELGLLYERVKGMLVREKFKIVKDDATENAYHLRAVKTQVTRIIIGAARDIELVIAGDPDNFAVVIIVGAWGKNLAISAATGFVVASTIAAPALVVGSIAAAGSYVTAKKFEESLFNQIKKEIEKAMINEATDPPSD